MAEVVRYVDPDATGTGDGTSWTNAYTSLSAWNAAEATNLVTATDNHVVYCRSGSGTADTTPFDITNTWVTSATYDLKIIGDASTGAWDTSAYRLTGAEFFAVLFNYANYLTIENLQIDSTENTNNGSGISQYAAMTGAGAVTIRRCVIRGSGTTTSSDNCGIDIDHGTSAGWTITITDNIVYDFQVGIRFSTDTNDVVRVYNNTVVDCVTGIHAILYGSADTLSMRNNLVYGCTDDYLINDAADTSTITHNSYSEGTDPGTSGVDLSLVASGDLFTNYAGDVFTIISGSDVIDAGIGPSSDALVQATDIQGDSRTGTTTDIGADRYAAAGSTQVLAPSAGLITLTSAVVGLVTIATIALTPISGIATTVGYTPVIGGTHTLTPTAGVVQFNGIAPASVLTGQDELYFTEGFEDSNLASRSWFDNSVGVISTTETRPGSSGSAEFAFSATDQTAGGIGAYRKLFTATDDVYIKYWAKYSANWVGSAITVHPHEFYFLTTDDSEWSGLSDTHLTAYVEQNGGTPRLAIQDAQNIDEANIGVNLIGVTETRAVAGCNGVQAMGQTSSDCYEYSGPTDHRNEVLWDADTQFFGDTPGPYYKNDWHQVEALFKMNSITGGIANFDGEIHFWFDGILRFSHTNVMFRTGDHPTKQFRTLIISPYIGVGSPIAQTMWVDDLTIANARLDVEINCVPTTAVVNAEGSIPTIFAPVESSHFVSPAGVAAWSASTDESSPTDIETAMANAVAGDTVYLRGGTYSFSFAGADAYIPALNPTNSGTALNPITFRAYPGETPIINGYYDANNPAAFGASGVDYIIWDGIYGTMGECPAGYNTNWLAVLYNSTGSIIRNCHLLGVTHGPASSGGNAAPLRMEDCTNSSLYNNIIHECYGSTTHVNQTGIWLMSNVSCNAYNNHVYNCDNGISQKVGPDIDVSIYRNFIHDIDVESIRISEEGASGGPAYIYENLILDSGSNGIYLEGSAVTLNNYQIYNNTIVRCRYGITCIPDVRGLIFYDNIIYECTTNIIYYTGLDWPSISDFTCYYNSSTNEFNVEFSSSYYSLAAWQAYSSLDADSIDGDPLFTVGTGTVTTNYSLDTGSPAIGTGRYGGNMGVPDLSLVGVLGTGAQTVLPSTGVVNLVGYAPTVQSTVATIYVAPTVGIANIVGRTASLDVAVNALTPAAGSVSFGHVGRENQVPSSEDLSDSRWVPTRASVSPNAIQSSDGLLTADGIVPSVDNNSHQLTWNYDFGSSMPASNIVTVDIEVRQGSESSVFFDIYTTSRYNNFSGWITFNNGQLLTASSISLISASATSLGSGWHRLRISFTSPATPGSSLTAIVRPTRSLLFTFPGDGVTPAVYVSRFAVRWGSSSNTYVTTTGTAIDESTSPPVVDTLTPTTRFPETGLVTASGITVGVVTEKLVPVSPQTGVVTSSGSVAEITNIVGRVVQPLTGGVSISSVAQGIVLRHNLQPSTGVVSFAGGLVIETHGVYVAPTPGAFSTAGRIPVVDLREWVPTNKVSTIWTIFS